MRFLAALVEGLPVALVAIDKAGTCQIFNAAAEHLFGPRPSAECPHDTTQLGQLFRADGATPLARHELPLIRGLAGEAVLGERIVIKNAAHPDGRLLSANAGPVRDATGAVLGSVSVLRDVTGEVEADRRLRAAETAIVLDQRMDAIDRAANSVAHDFNNVLTVITSYAALLQQSLDVDRPERADAEEIGRSAARASALTRRLLTLGRLGASEPRPVDPNTAIDGVAKALMRLVGADVELVIERGQLAAVSISPEQLEQVLVNLAVNARDAMPDGGRLTIETSLAEIAGDGEPRGDDVAVGRHVVLAVTDTGIGMDEVTRRRIFEPFFTTKPAREGRGLGLAIVRSIVRQAGGTITVCSAPGHGTTFRVYLPAADTAPSTPMLAAETAVPAVVPPVRLILVDDDEQVRAVAARVLREAGCTVIEASTAEEARRRCLADEDDVAVLFTDLVLPDLRGDTLAAQLVALRPTMRVILTSGYSIRGLAGDRLVPAYLLPKPYTPSGVRQAVASVLGGAAETSDSRPSDSRSDVRLLLVDDDSSFRGTVARMLVRTGIHVVESDHASDAVEKLRRERFDVVVSDVQMPGADGIELLRSIRRVELDIPVILVTGAPEVASAAKALEYGAFRYLSKPVSNDELAKVVRHAARSHALARIRREAMSVTGAHTKSAADRAGLEVRFDAALETIWIAFQPIVDARTGALFGVEALVRSDDPIMPDPRSLLDAATRLGRLPQLGRRIRALAAESLASSPVALTLFVNLHPEDLVDADLIARAAPLSAMAKRVVLEVTERAALERSATLSSRLARLRDLGFRLAVDDIGAGYSGLTSFAELTPEVVKIDLSLVRDVHLSTVRQRTIRSICALSHELEARVVGEGVETSSERDCLVELGCDLLQGYLFGRPSRELPI